MSLNTITIRHANSNDVASLALLMTELGYPTSIEEMKQRFDFISNDDKYKTFIAESAGTVVGMAGATQAYFYERNHHYVRLLVLVTRSDQRNKGIGKALTEAAEQWAIEIGATALLLNCGNRIEREAAHNFYKKMGYAAKSTGYIKELHSLKENR